ncbi:GHMP kinase [Flavobacteriaceae bacterium XHP0103]|uniref:GYDIA family GHMP kinase n=1 Tax=Marixanthotalea marina TaxID=2844359 RepID=UPI002989AFE7|nr:GYDIA family GHMP kinase [Marixanthotalea marina]MBU3821048.1 GHMP kinase [Marixanthotalea marina]
MKNGSYYSNGKLLLTGEYVVLDGATALAIPTKYGQSLTIESIDEPKLIWTSFDEKKQVWFENEFKLSDNGMLKQDQHDDISTRIIQILNAAKSLNPTFLNSSNGFKISTFLNFPRNWGLGTSSTLINNIAQWAQVDAYLLLEKTFGGSGYDIACAQTNQPLTYRLQQGKPIVKLVDFNPTFSGQLYFVYLNKKQNSRDGIAHYKANKDNVTATIDLINSITTKMIACQSLPEFENLIVEHETIISRVTKQKTVKDLLFKDFEGEIKSLGAWGGDFILVTSKNNPRLYFEEKGFNTIIPFNQMVLK